MIIYSPNKETFLPINYFYFFSLSNDDHMCNSHMNIHNESQKILRIHILLVIYLSSFLSFFISFFLPSFLSSFLPSFLSFFPILSFSSSCYFFLLSVLLVFIFVSLCLSLCSYSHSSFSVPPFSVPPFSVPPFSVPPFSEECDLQQKFHIDNVKHLPKFYAHFLKARFLFET